MELALKNGLDDRIGSVVDVDNIERIVIAYNKAKSSQKVAADHYQVGDLWSPIYDKHMKEITAALTSENVNEVGKIYANFFREPCSWGLHGLPVEDMNATYFSGRVSEEYFNLYMKDALNRIEIWLNTVGKTSPISDLETPIIGNPYGYYLDETFIRAGVDYQHYYATIIKRLTNNSNAQKFVLELGGGFGGLADFLLRDTPGLTYIDVDLPENMALTAFYLLSAYPNKKIALYGEIDHTTEDLSQYDAVLLPNFSIADLKDDSIDLSFNSYSLAEMPLETVTNYINHFNRITTKFIYHVNHTKFSTVKADDFPIDLDKFEVISRAPALWNMGRDSNMDEFEYIFKNKKLGFA